MTIHARPAEPSEAKLAAKAWLKGDHELGRHLYQACVEKAKLPDALLPPSYYLSEWARHEGGIGNRESFETLYHEAIQSNPNAPFWLLCYARDTWTEFKDGPACLQRVAILEELLASDRWDRSMDLAPLAYSQKIETLRAWVRGEPGGPIWP